VLALGLVLCCGAVGAQQVDLSYPPQDAASVVVDTETGESNPGTPLSPEQARHRAEDYDRLHVIIGPNFTVRPKSVPQPEKPAAEPKRSAPTAAPQPATAPTADSAALSRYNRGLLWRVQRGKSPASHLFGTIHVEDPRVLKLPRTVMQALVNSNSYTMETLLDQAPGSFSTAMLYSDGQTLSAVAGEDLYKQVSGLLAPRQLPDRVINSLKPWAAMTLLVQPQPQTGVFLDQALLRIARERELQTFGLESLEEQLAALDGLSPQDQLALLREAVANHDTLTATVEAMVRAWLARDLVALQAASQPKHSDDQQLQAQLLERLVDRRNPVMLERMQPRLAEGGAFIAVGALHLPGKKGLLHGLEQQGYRVTKVY